MKALKFLGAIGEELLRIAASTILITSMIIGLCRLEEAVIGKIVRWRDNRKSKKEAENDIFTE